VAKGGFKLNESVEAVDPEAPPPAPGEVFQLVGKDGQIAGRDLWAFAVAHGGFGPLFQGGKARWFAPQATTEKLATMLERQLQRKVVDATGLKGKYDFKLWWSPVADSDDSDGGPTLFGALQNQLGLKLESKKALVEVLVVDHAERFPTEN